jgi:hypothetical protein
MFQTRGGSSERPARPDEDALARLLLEARENHGFCRVAEIGQAQVRVVAEAREPILIGLESGHDLSGVQAWERRVIGSGEIDECGVQANHQHTFFGCHVCLLGVCG